MKKLIKLAFGALLLSYALISCEEESNPSLNTQTELSKLMEIAPEELPDVTEIQLGNFTFENKSNLNGVLDLENNTLTVPVKYFQSNPNKTVNDLFLSGEEICIKIARRRYKEACYGSCVACIGFRCGLCDKSSSQSDLSKSRNQNAKVSFDIMAKNLIFEFKNDIDWRYLENEI